MKEYQALYRLQFDQSIGTERISVQHHSMQRYPQHWHSYFEIELILSGTATHIYNGTEYSISPGDLYLLTPVDFHGIAAEDSLELVNISFDESCLPPNLLSWFSSPEAEKFLHLSGDDFDRFHAAIDLLRHECRCDGPCAMQLLEYLLSYFTHRCPKQPSHTAGAEHLQGISKAIAYISLHFRESITLEQLAVISGYNPSYFSELFRKVTGKTYKQQLCELRISYAKMLLANGLSVSETCFASGFGSLSNFTAVFREKCGMPPKVYQNTLSSPQQPKPE